jgi:hypothetical protein
MNRKTRPALFFVFTSLLVVVCRCGSDPLSKNDSAIMLKDGTRLGSCEVFSDFTQTSDNPDGFTSTTGWECSVTCPDGSQTVFELDGKQSAPSFYNDPFLEAGDTAGFLSQYCSPEAMVAANTPEVPTLTPSPTSTSTAQAAAQEQVIIIPTQNLLILPPVLAGGVTACDTGLGFINFPLASPQPDLSGRSVSILLNGNKLNCKVAGSQSQVLGCSLPPGASFPATVSASIDDVQVNNFPFDGAICTNTVPTKETQDSASPATAEPPVDCEENPYHIDC